MNDWSTPLEALAMWAAGTLFLFAWRAVYRWWFR